MYHEFASDAKVQSMPEAMQRRLLMLFCLRCSNTLVTLQDDELAFALRITPDELAETKVLFLRKNFIDEDWDIRQWDDRQFVSDSSAPRVKRHREKKKAQAPKVPEILIDEAMKQVGNVTLTPQIQNRTDTEHIKTSSEQSSDGVDPDGPKAEKGKKRRGTEADFKAARWMFGQVLAVNPTAKPPNFDGWADHVRMMREIDGRTHKDMCELFQWAKKDTFWAPNIQSPSKLRERWDQLVEVRIRASAPKGDGAWWATDKTMADKGAEFGIASRPGENPLAFKARIQECIDNGGKPIVRAPGPAMVVRDAGPKSVKPEGIGKLSALVGASKDAA